jgi:hypothetical protein
VFIDPSRPQGTWIHVPNRGLLVNGQLDDDAGQRLRELGGTVVPYIWVDPTTDDTWFERASDEEKRERNAADLMLGRLPNAEGVTRTERDIEASMAKVLKPLRKATHLEKMKRSPRPKW